MSALSSRSGLAVLLVLALTALAACDGDRPLEPVLGEITVDAARSPDAAAGRAAFMTRNLYLGTAVEPLFAPGLDPEEIPSLVAQAWQQVLATDFEERAAALVEEIGRRRPHAVGLQEVTLYQMEVPSSPAPATDVVLDFEAILLAKLAERGLDYEVAAKVQNVVAELPMFEPTAPPPHLADIRLTDHDVALVRGGVNWREPAAANYIARVPVPIPGSPVPLEITRGWASVEVEIEGTWYRFLTTHLEPVESGPGFQEAQAMELLAVLASESAPIVTVGDFNADPRDDADTYDILTDQGGFSDAWAPRGDGLTCCQPPDLANRRSMLERRVDLILMRGDFGLSEPGILGGVQAEIFGHRTSDRTDAGLWPSDHAGVAAVVHLPQRR